jgi:hypothetical protein
VTSSVSREAKILRRVLIEEDSAEPAEAGNRQQLLLGSSGGELSA